MHVFVLIALLLSSGCTSGPAYQPDQIRTETNAEGRTATRLGPVMLKKMWDSDVTLELVKLSTTSLVGLTVQREGADARNWKGCNRFVALANEELVRDWTGNDVAYESWLEPQTGTTETVTVTITLDQLAAVAGADTATLSVCGMRFEMGEVHRKYVAEYLAAVEQPSDEKGPADGESAGPNAPDEN